MKLIKNYVVKFETRETYNCESKEEAIEEVKREFGGGINIIEVIE